MKFNKKQFEIVSALNNEITMCNESLYYAKRARFWLTAEKYYFKFCHLLDRRNGAEIVDAQDYRSFFIWCHVIDTPCADGLWRIYHMLQENPKVPGYVKGYFKKSFKKFYPNKEWLL